MGRGPGLGGPYRRLWTASAVSTLGDGMYLAALPLLAATLTRDPLPVSAVMFAEWLPWLLFGLLAGAPVRVDLDVLAEASGSEQGARFLAEAAAYPDDTAAIVAEFQVEMERVRAEFLRRR